MRLYPYERFLRFLTSRKLDVNRMLERFGLPLAGDIWLVTCRRDLRTAAPFALSHYLNSPEATQLELRDDVLEWADAEGIRVLWEMQPEFGEVESPDFDAALRLFINPTSRAIVGMLLLASIADRDAIELLKGQLGVEVTTAQYNLYKSLFWDVSRVQRTDWAGFVTCLKTPEEINYISFGLDGPTLEAIRDVLDMDVDSVDHRSILNQIISKSYHQYKRAMASANPEAHNAAHWAELALKAISTAKATGSLMDPNTPRTGGDRFRGLFSVETTRSKIPSLAELSGEVGKRVEKAEPEAPTAAKVPAK